MNFCTKVITSTIDYPSDTELTHFSGYINEIIVKLY